MAHNSQDHMSSDGARSARQFRRSCLAQSALIVVLLFGDIGFDRPGRFGLDFGHLLLLIGVEAILVAWALRTAIRARSWTYLGIQALLLALAGMGASVRALV